MSGEKPFDATPSRLERARREGDLPTSSDAAVLGAFGAGLLALAVTAAPAAGAAAEILKRAAYGGVEAGGYLALGCAALAPALASFAGAIGFQHVVAGRIVFRPPTLKLERLNPLGGLRAILSRETTFALVKSLAAGFAVGCASAPAIAAVFAEATRAATPQTLVALALRSLNGIAVAALAVAALATLLDVAVQRERWRRRLRMDFDELRRDLKENEGDPHARSRRRGAHGALIRGSLERVREAAFVVANPTHVAIALGYAPPRIAVPLVLVRAINGGALLVKRRARELGIPIVEDAELARSLLAITQVGASIPHALYDAVARIVAVLLRSGKIGSPA